jgi:hypothetical protein
MGNRNDAEHYFFSVSRIVPPFCSLFCIGRTWNSFRVSISPSNRELFSATGVKHDNHSYFSAVFAASKTFPEWIGIASALPMVLFGLSPLFLSLFASYFFTDPGAGLNLVRYFVFLALLCGFANIFGAFVLHVPQHDTIDVIDTVAESNLEPGSEPDETTSLLSEIAANVITEVVVIEEPKQGSVLDLLKDPHFWILATSLLLTLGSVE